MYGPTAGDRVRLGDTDLFALVERDYTDYGNEILGGWGKNLRTGMMYSHRPARDSELDNVISNAIVMDPVMGSIQGKHRHKRRDHRWGRQGGQPRHNGRC